MDFKDSPVSASSDEALAKSVPTKHMTPCRQMGLRRKFGSAKSDDTSFPKKVCLSTPSFSTPKGTPRQPARKKLMSPNENNKFEYLPVNNIIDCKPAVIRSLNCNRIGKNNENISNSSTVHTQVSVEDDKVEFSFNADSIESVSQARSALEDIKMRIDAKEKLKNSLQQRLFKMKKGNEHVSRLRGLQEDWKEACQESLRDLLDKTNMQGQSLTMKQLMEKLGISNELLPYNSDEEEFGEYYP